MSDTPLFDPICLGKNTLSHRVVLAPMTRARADSATLAPTADTVQYYGQRASGGGMVITEAVHISPEATPVWNIYSNVREDGGGVPGIWTDSQVERWRDVTKAVHAKGGLISCQLLHTGRIAQPGIGEHPLVQGTGAPLPPVSSSAVALKAGQDAGDYSWDQPSALPRALTTSEIARVVDDYRIAARNADRAGFDYVELHAAHGYLVEQFLCDGINKRTDQYGGIVANRSRFLFEIVDALVAELGPDRVGVRLSPTAIDPATGRLFQMYFDADWTDPEALYAHAIAGLNAYGLAYMMLTEPRVGALSVDPDKEQSFEHPLRNKAYRALYDGPLIGAGGFTPVAAAQAVAEGHYDMIAFGRWFLSTPDLPARLLSGAALNIYDRKTFYGGGAQGYTDYPTLDQTDGFALMEQTDIGASLATSRKSRKAPTS